MTDLQHFDLDQVDTLDWDALRIVCGYRIPKPEAPALPPSPGEPRIPDPPREEDPVYDVELSTMDKLFASRRIKKQQAALRRFEKDRKAWVEDRQMILATFEMARKKREAEVASIEETYETAIAEWQGDLLAYARASGNT